MDLVFVSGDKGTTILTLYCQLDWILNHQRNTPLGVNLSYFSIVLLEHYGQGNLQKSLSGLTVPEGLGS